MKRIPKDPDRFGAIDLYEAIARKYDLRLGEESSEDRFIKSVSESLGASRTNPIVLHGRRVEAMFGFVAASLGRAIAIKEEDAGELFAADTSIKTPDYRLVLDPGNEFFVEVKNCHRRNPEYRLPFRQDYLEGLRRYGELFGREVKIAVYWSRWGVWTMISLGRIPVNGDGKSYLSMLKAVKINEMADLGDRKIGTKPPLTFRLVADTSKPRGVGRDGEVKFTIGQVEIHSSGKRIDDAEERDLAFYLMLYGEWIASEPVAKIEDGRLIFVQVDTLPKEPTPDQGFEIIGDLSGMISRRYNDLTTSDGEIDRLSPSVEPASLGALLKDDYKGKFLPLWRFHQQPNYETG